ncbi:MAG TPA: ATP-binding protein [Terriglobales bacterium]|nr:ATP-binding protein [Terriglobales bacterium]
MEPHLRILHTVAQAVSRSLDVDEVLRTALDALTHVTGHEMSSLHLITPDGLNLQLKGERGLPAKLRDVNVLLPVGKGQLGGVAATGVTLVLKSAADDPTLLPAARDAMENDRIRGLVCVAIHSRERILGTLTLGRRTDEPFTEREVALVEATGDQIGIALDNARLYSETRRQLEELQRAQAQLIHAEKLSAVGQLASGVAHEINNPLTTILGQTHLLMTQQPLSEHVRDRLSIIADETARAARIVQNLLLFSRHYPPERQPCLLEDQVRRVLDLKAYQLQQDGTEVVTEFGSCPPVWADGHQLQQVLLNLVQNAHHAMTKREGPRVLTVRTSADAKHATLAVLDTGPGIPADVLPRIFDPFFTTKPPGEGSGLGLSVSYGIVAEHRGRLWAENRPEGGAAFFLELPLED